MVTFVNFSGIVPEDFLIKITINLALNFDYRLIIILVYFILKE